MHQKSLLMLIITLLVLSTSCQVKNEIPENPCPPESFLVDNVSFTTLEMDDPIDSIGTSDDSQPITRSYFHPNASTW